MAERGESDSGEGYPDLSELSEVSNVLLLAPSLGGHGSSICFDLLTQTPPDATNVLSVTFTRSPTEWTQEWEEAVEESPVRGGIVGIGQADASVDDAAWAVKTVESPSDLTGIGIQLSELLSGMANAADDEEDIVMCFNSITSLLQYADLQRAFRFLHVVTGRIKTVDGVGHYHLDPEAHDDQTLATLKGLFDAVIQQTDDGDWEIQR